MPICVRCGTENAESKFCPICGAPRTDLQGEPTQQMPNAENAAYFSAPSPSANTVTYSSMPYPASRPSAVGQTVFSIINMVLGSALCCYSLCIPTILGIIAAIFCAQAGSEPTDEEAYRKLNTAKILNIIGVIFLGLGVLFVIIVTIFCFAAIASFMEVYRYTF